MRLFLLFESDLKLRFSVKRGTNDNELFYDCSFFIIKRTDFFFSGKKYYHYF
jgi:hypothetical protein